MKNSPKDGSPLQRLLIQSHDTLEFHALIEVQEVRLPPRFSLEDDGPLEWVTILNLLIPHNHLSSERLRHWVWLYTNKELF